MAKAKDGSVVTGLQVAWASLSEANASVQEHGATALVTALQAGPVTVAATVQGKVGTAALSIAARLPVAASVAITTGGGFLEVGEEAHLRAVVTGDDGSIMDGSGLVWSTDNEEVAAVAPLEEPAVARVRARGPGAAKITARLGELSAEVRVTVGPASQPTSAVGVVPNVLTVELGKTITLQAVAWALDGSWIEEPVTHWSTSDAAVATVDAGASASRAILTARAPGTVTIHAASGGRAAAAQITVVPTPDVGYVILGRSEQSLWKGQFFRFNVQVLGRTGGTLPGAPVLWTVDDPTVADVDASGQIHARKAGTTRVVAESGGVQGVATIRVREWPVEGALSLTLQAGTDPWGMPRLLPRLGTALWTDSLGVEHEASLWLRSGGIAFHGDGRYTQHIKVDVRIPGFGGILQLVEQRIEEVSGVVGYHVLDPYTLFLHPDGGGPMVEMRPWQGQAGKWVTDQKFGDMPLMDWLWTME